VKADFSEVRMEDGTYKTSLVKKQIIFLALRSGEKTIAEVLRGLKKALKETENGIVARAGDNDGHIARLRH
jgi:hypothetical protein